MSTDPEKLEGLETLQRIAAEALDNEAYRRELIRDPKAELAKAGLRLPRDVEVEVLENTPSKLYIVLPSRRDREDDNRDQRRAYQLLTRWPV